MTPPAFPFVAAARRATDARNLLLAGVASLLSGCVGNPFEDAQVDPASPLAAEVTRAARANTDFPSFSEIPPVPTDVRPLRMFGQAKGDLELARAQLERETAPQTWTLADTETFVARARREVGPDLPPVNQSDTDAYAEELRRRATPPPLPKR